jgi:hypothetical protein
VVPLTEPLTDFPTPASGGHPAGSPLPASGDTRAAGLTRPLTVSPLPASGDFRAAVVSFPFSGTGDERSTVSPDATPPGFRPAESNHPR